MPTSVILVAEWLREPLLRTATVIQQAVVRLGRDGRLIQAEDDKAEWVPSGVEDSWLLGIRDGMAADGVLVVPCIRAWRCVAAADLCRDARARTMAVCGGVLGFVSGAAFLKHLERRLGPLLRKKVLLVKEKDPACGFDPVRSVHRVPRGRRDEILTVPMDRLVKKFLRTRRT